MIVVLNANTLAVSEYDIDAIDVVERDGDVYVVKIDGLRRFAAEVDEEDVLSYVQTGDLALSPGRRVTVDRAMAVLSANAPMQIETLMKIDGAADSVSYPVPLMASERSRARKIKFGRGPRADRWALKLSASGPGVRWALDELAVAVGQSMTKAEPAAG